MTPSFRRLSTSRFTSSVSSEGWRIGLVASIREWRGGLTIIAHDVMVTIGRIVVVHGFCAPMQWRPPIYFDPKAIECFGDRVDPSRNYDASSGDARILYCQRQSYWSFWPLPRHLASYLLHSKEKKEGCGQWSYLYDGARFHHRFWFDDFFVFCAAIIYDAEIHETWHYICYQVTLNVWNNTVVIRCAVR